MLTMAHRLATGLFNIPEITTKDDELANEDAILKTQVGAFDVAKNGVQIVCDNVREYFKHSEKLVWHWDKDFPNLAPPAEKVVFSWTDPQDKNIVAGEVVVRDTQKAVTMAVIDLREMEQEEVSQFINRVYGNAVGEKPAIDELLRARWVLCFSFFFELNGVPVWSGINKTVLVSPTGEAIETATHGLATCVANLHQSNSIMSMMVIAFLAICFMHCKNVVRKDATDEVGPPKKWLRRKKCPEIKCYTLDIDPMKQVLRTEGGIETNGLKKALHICRGHFAHYTDENPLFGRITGTFWKPQHVRGSKEFGEVKKDYRIKV